MTRAVIIHSLDHARAAMKAAAGLGTQATLLSAPGAAAYAGAGWFLEVIAIAQSEHPTAAVIAVLDCADHPGLVLGALRGGCRAVRFAGCGPARKRIEDIAGQYGAILYETDAPALDLAGEPDPEEACRIWLSGN
jgi:hypothetical protein